MPQQELFFEERAGDRLITVLKSYDRSYAREVFGNVGDAAMKSLAAALEIERKLLAGGYTNSRRARLRGLPLGGVERSICQYPRQSRGLDCVSRSKRLERGR